MEGWLYKLWRGFIHLEIESSSALLSIQKWSEGNPLPSHALFTVVREEAGALKGTF